MYVCMYGFVGSSFTCEGLPQSWQAGPTLHRGGRAFHYRGPSRCRAQAPDAQAQQLWLAGPAAPWHVGSSQTRARTPIPRIGRQTLNHCATREAQNTVLHKLNVHFINMALYPERDPKFAVEADVCLPARLPAGVRSPPPCVEEAKHNREKKSERKVRRREENEQRTGRNNTK